MILGEQVKNAYSVSNMQNAVLFYNKLYPKDSPFLDKKIIATHQYVKITPTTERDLLQLEEMANNNRKIHLSGYPLDYKIIKQGSNYVDPNYTGKPELQPLYTTIPAGYSLTVPYIVLADLYKPSEKENDIETIAMAMVGWQDDLRADFNADVTLDNVSQFLDGPTGQNELFRRPFNPIGIIAMQVYDNGTIEGLKLAEISLGRWFWWDQTFTNENGFFVSPSNYRGNVSIRSTWRNATATLRSSKWEVTGFDVSDFIMTMDTNNWLFTYVILNYGADSKMWFKGAVHNGLHKYYQYAFNNGVTPVTNANIWVWKTGSGSASTPMFKQMQNIPIVSAFNSWSQPSLWATFLNSTFGIASAATNIVAPYYQHLMPDQLYTGLEGYGFKLKDGFTSNRRIEQIVFHESGHFSHALRAGTNNYSKLVASELKNDQSLGSPYYDGTRPTPDLGKQIALAEGWATYMENKCMQHYYGSTFEINGNLQSLPTYIENFTMLQTPSTLPRTDAKSWFLTGLLWDLTDNNQDINSKLFDGTGEIFLNNIYDIVSLPNTPFSIYYHLNSDVYNGNDLKAKLQLTYPAQWKNIYELYLNYGQ